MKNYAPSSLEIFSRKICELAKNRDSIKLAEIADDYFLVDMFQTSRYSPLHLLADEGNIDTCEWLAKEWQLDLKEAVQGFAANGYFEKVDQLLANGASKAKAAGGYAYMGDFERAKSLIDFDAEKMSSIVSEALCEAILKSAQNGLTKQVQAFIDLVDRADMSSKTKKKFVLWRGIMRIYFRRSH